MEAGLQAPGPGLGLPVQASQDLQAVWNMVLSQSMAQQRLHRLFSSLSQSGQAQPEGPLPPEYQHEVCTQARLDGGPKAPVLRPWSSCC